MKTSSSYDARLVLVFGKDRNLYGIFGSLTAAAKVTNIRRETVFYACSGSLITAGGFYFRYLNDNVEIKHSDLGTLKLEKYDCLCNEPNRKIYSTRKLEKKYITTSKKLYKGQYLDNCI